MFQEREESPGGLLHGEEIPEDTLANAELQHLLEKYLRNHLQSKRIEENIIPAVN